MKIYSDIETRKTYCERWGASTKHPDAMFCFDDHITSDWCERGTPWDLYQWLLETAVDVAYPPQLVHNVEYVQKLMRQYAVAIDGDAEAWEILVRGL